MELFWAPRTRALTAVWMLEEAGLPYQRVLIDIHAGPERPADFLKVNPMGKVPALRDGAAMMAEATAICAYVADKAAGSGLAPAPDDPARGRYLHWLFFRAGCMEPAYGEKLYGSAIPPVAAGWGSFDKVMDVVEAAVTPGPWLLGDRFTAADVAMGSSLWFGMTVLKVVKDRSGIEAYVDCCTARPAFQRALAIDTAEG
ncbi:glutathione S-transferase family protein [Pedomonas sp. V897]|uniref:glutathione S-transferase family protein n=1 Tax=Pedomonas sp. V897 TaxID=3446482 RepID=UPI003EE38067